MLLALAAVALLSSRVTHHAFLRLEEVRATKHRRTKAPREWLSPTAATGLGRRR